MRALLAILFLLPTLAWSAAPTECWDGSYSTGDECPVQVTGIVPDLSPGSTDATVTVNLAASADTLYVWAKEAVGGNCPTAPTVAQIVGGTGSPDATGTKASPTSGANTVELTGLTADTEYCAWAVASKNGIPSIRTSGNSNAKAASVPWFTAPVPGGLVKWNPGHYMMQKVNRTWVQRQGDYDAITDSTAVVGAVMFAYWGNLEPTQDNFNWTTIQQELDYLKALNVPKRLFVRIFDKRENSDGCTNRTYYPAWLDSAGLCVQTDTTKFTLKWWDATLKAEYIELLQAMAAEFDDDPYFEGIVLIRETGLGGQTTSAPGFNKNTYVANLKEIALAAQEAFTTSNVILYTNFINGGSTPDIVSLLAWQLANGIGQGSPDTAPDCVVRDLYCTSGWNDPQRTSSEGGPRGIPATAYNYANDSLIGQVPITWSVESSQLGTNVVGQTGGYAPELIRQFANQYVGVSHLFWMRNDFAGVSIQQWATSGGIEDIIEANPSLTNSGCPASHVARGGCLTGGTE